jgi:hypothetical protein
MPLFDFKKDKDFAYLIMPFAEESLADRIEMQELFAKKDRNKITNINLNSHSQRVSSSKLLIRY